MCDVRREENSEEYVEIIEFDDGSTLKIPEIWKECAKLKYGMEWPEYWSKFKEVVDNLWTNGRVLTKFGEEDIERTLMDIPEDSGEPDRMTRAKHAEMCIYADLRPCIIAKFFASAGLNITVVTLQRNGDVRVYSGDSVEEKSVEEVFSDLLRDLNERITRSGSSEFD